MRTHVIGGLLQTSSLIKFDNNIKPPGATDLRDTPGNPQRK